MAASSTTYGKAVTETTTLAEAGGTTGAKTSMATESSGMDKGTSGHNTRVTPDNATKTTVTTIQEISQNKLDCQVPEERVRRFEEQSMRCTNDSRGWSVAMRLRTQESVEKKVCHPRVRTMTKIILGGADGRDHGGYE